MFDDYKRFDSQQICLQPNDENQYIIKSIGEKLGFRWAYLYGRYKYMSDNIWVDDDLPKYWHWSATINKNYDLFVQICRTSTKTKDDHAILDFFDPNIIDNIRSWQYRIACKWIKCYKDTDLLIDFHTKYLQPPTSV